MTVVVIIALALLVVWLVSAVKKSSRPANSAGSAPSSFAESYPFSEILPDPDHPHVRTIRTKIRGVSHKNQDGTSRQQIIRGLCREGDALCLVREPENPFDSNAIKVCRIVYADKQADKPRLGEHLGYVSKELAEELAPRMDEGNPMFAHIVAVTGGTTASRTLGVNINIEEYRRKAKAAKTVS